MSVVKLPLRRNQARARYHERCKALFLQGLTIAEICAKTGAAERTVLRWRKEEAWDAEMSGQTVEQAMSQRLILLVNLDHKTPEQNKEIQLLTETLGKHRKDWAVTRKIEAETRAIESGKIKFLPPGAADYTPRGKLSDPDAPRPDRQPRSDRGKKRVKNDISEIDHADLDRIRNELFFDYQQLWFEHRNERIRFILKSRQIGATYYFAWEAFDRAVRDGENCIFLSASRDQAEMFKGYIIAFALKYFQIELKGTSVITLSNGAELRFLSTNSNTAQSYHGHLYIDEVFWIPKYQKLNKVASGMAAHKKWRITKFSTPSAISHEAYAEWSGELFNQGKPDDKKIEFDISHAALKNGHKGPDGRWRHIVNIYDAQAQGCDLFDIEELKLEYSENDFKNLFGCEFIDDSQSVFALSKLLDCTVEVDEWPDYHPEFARPFANKPVSLGYDPSRVRDNASLAELSIPLSTKDVWRVLHTDSFHGQNFQYQASQIKQVVDTRNVQHLGVDTTGIGQGVFELVQAFYPQATPIHYSLDMKTRLVIKALDVIENKRFRYKAADHHITRAFLMITKTTTGSGQITYASSRNAQAGHADVAWSIMHALQYEPIDNDQRKSSVTFSK